MISIKFKELKPFISRLEPLSICMYETNGYENFIRLQDVPDTYDDYYIYGIGMIKSEFYQVSKYEYSADRNQGKLAILPCIEIVLSKVPRVHQDITG